MTNRVTVIPYNPLWPALFEQEAILIKQILGDNCIEIHHVGSTAVPGLAAKPIIDMIPVVKDITQVDLINEKMQSLGYEVKGEAGMLFRRFFKKENAPIESNVHIYEQGAGETDRMLKFRDWMRTHPEDRDVYAALKENLAHKYPTDITAYCLEKEAFVTSIDQKTGYDGLRCVLALSPREWEAYHRIHKEQFFSTADVYDKNHPALTTKNHFHLTLYKGTEIICVAHVEFVNTMAIIRSLATDMPYQNQGYDNYMRQLLETWIKQQGKNL